MLSEATYDRMRSLRDALKPLVAAREEVPAANVTGLWQNILAVQKYVFELSPEHLARIRLHTNYFTRFSPSTFQRFIRDRRAPEIAEPVRRYEFFATAVPEAYWIAEPPLVDSPLPTGFPWRGRAINPEVVRYQACISNLYTSAVLDYVRKAKDPVIVEIGGGFGGLALGLLQALHNLPVTYVIVDMPDLLLFPGCYILANRPEEDVVLCRSTTDTARLAATHGRRRLVLWPINLNAELERLPPCHLTISMASLQEMSPGQIAYYSRCLAEKTIGYLYSENTECHPDNHELSGSSVSAILEQDWCLCPPTAVYETHQEMRGPWSHRTYLATSRRHSAAPPAGAIRFMGNKPRGGKFVYDMGAQKLSSVEEAAPGDICGLPRAAKLPG